MQPISLIILIVLTILFSRYFKYLNNESITNIYLEITDYLKSFIKNKNYQTYGKYLLCYVGKHRFIINPNDTIVSNHLRKGLYYEQYMHKYFDLYNDKNYDKNSVCLDIGANIGCHSVYLSELFKKIYCFEPQKKVYQLLKYNLALNKCDNAHTFNIALGNRNSIDYLTCFDDKKKHNIGGVSIVGKDSGCEKILVKTLDSLAIKEKIRLIKIDVEGHESKVLEGAKNTILKNKPIIIFEEWNFFSNPLSFRILKSWNYNIKRISFSNFIAIPK